MYLTLSSSFSPEFFPKDKVSDYIVNLPNELTLKGPWEVGLAEVICSHSWYNIDTEQYWVIYQHGDVQIKTKVHIKTRATNTQEFLCIFPSS